MTQNKENKIPMSLKEIVSDQRFQKTLSLNVIFTGLGVAAILIITSFLFS